MTTNSINIIMNQANQAEITTDISKAILDGQADGRGDSNTLLVLQVQENDHGVRTRRRTGASRRANCGPPPGVTATPSRNWPP